MDSLPIWLLVVAYAAHIMEEYFLDWRNWAESVSKINISWAEFFISNTAVIIFGFCCAFVGYTWPIFSYMFVGLALVNALFAHIGTTVVKKRFSPGIITSTIFFIPISIWAYIEGAKKGILTPLFISVTIFGGGIIMLYPIFLQKLKKHMVNKNQINL